MPLDLYYAVASPPSRAVLLVANAAGIKLNLKYVDLTKGEHLTPEYLKMNQQHTIPLLDDNGFYLNESAIILTYLIDNYAKDDKLYPRDPKKRVLVDLRLQMGLGQLWSKLLNAYAIPVILGLPPIPGAMDKLQEVLGWLDNILKESTWVAGEQMTVADFSIVTTISHMDRFFGHEFSKHKNLIRWYRLCEKTMPEYEKTTAAGIKELKEWVPLLSGKK